MKHALAATAGVLTLALAALGQNVVIELSEGFTFSEATLDPPAPGSPPGADGEEDEEEEQTDRSKALAKLKFDRRPSAILEAWATPPEPEEPEPPTAPENTEDAGDAAAEEEATDAEAAEEPAGAEETEDGDAALEPVEELTEEEAEAAEKARKAEEKAAEKARKAAEKAAEKAREEAEEKALEAEMEAFQRMVTLGDWDGVRLYLEGLLPVEQKAGYTALIDSLVSGPPKLPGRFQNFGEKNAYSPEDLVGLAGAAPHELEPEVLVNLGVLLRQCIDEGGLIEEATAAFRAALDTGSYHRPELDVARIVLESGHPLESGAFLPEAEVAREENDRAALNLLSRHFLAQHEEDEKGGWLVQAWDVIQAVLADGEVSDEDKEEALQRAVEIAPRIREELGQEWLDESFTARPARGMEILAVIGTSASQGMQLQARSPELRLRALELQTTSADALLRAAPELAEGWRDTLNLLAGNWLREAQYTYENDTSTSRGPQLERDYYGNFYYYNYRPSISQNMPLPITTDEMLDIRPSDAWLAWTSPGIRPKFAMVTAQLLLKVSEEAEAFPYIERLAVEHPDRAVELVEEFLRVWSKNHNPNTNSRRTSSYMFVYGFEQRANAIPLTRSKQERNLVELAEWVARIDALPIEGVDEDLLASAFTAAHSQAEVYRIENIERVFGSLESLEPRTLAELVQKMRANLLQVWRDPNVQRDQGTKRRQKDIQAEVVRGYEVATAVVDRALEDHPDDWALTLARAAILHDENNYRAEISQDSGFAAKRGEALEVFARAAALYAAQVDELSEEEETTRVFEHWYYASLGASDLGAVDEEKFSVESQFPLIRSAIEALPGESAERHMGMFANTLFTRMSSVNPAVKFRYVREGLGIVGDHERAREARDVYEYYRDLVTEIRLETRIDGPDRVGHGTPFGLFVDLVHTREIEREAGGFSKYLVNQNAQAFAWNYGRPTEDYRDKFEEAAREALKEHFEVHSVTFNHPKTNSRALEEYGWRVTPYAYVLLQARGPEVDRVPPLRFDLDFLDTTGYAVLPVESPAVPIDALAAEGETPAFANLELVQTLDERQAEEGKLVLEVKAQANGLVPRLETLLDLSPTTAGGFELVTTEDQGLSISQFDEEADEASVLSERTWLLTLAASEGLEALPTRFTFAESRVEDAETLHQRFVDADLEVVEATVDLEETYGEKDRGPLVATVLGSLALLGLAVFVGLRILRAPKGPAGPAGRYQVPDNVSAFTVLGLLRDIETNNGLSAPERDELTGQIRELETVYFAEVEGGGGDLRSIAETWIQRVG